MPACLCLKAAQQQCHAVVPGDYTCLRLIFSVLQVTPGWKEGTRITFSGKGDEMPGQPPQDIVFVIAQKPHPR